MNDFYSMARGGEMGALIRETDWTLTPLGHPESWPPALRTSVAIMLENPFAMYIAWGEKYIQLYNDGFRPILGLSKHPQALGISTRKTFEEIWPIVGPMFQGVREGKPESHRDFMVPLNRNGFVEECYFDFAYSPIRVEDGKVEGVLVTVIETTTKNKALDELKESEERFRMMADNVPNLSWMAKPDGWIYWYNKQWYDYTGTTAEQMQGWGWQSVHDPHKLNTVLEKWKNSINTGRSFEMIFPLKGLNGLFRQFLTRVVPLFDKDGKIRQWFGTNTDITEQIETEQALQESEERFRNMAEGTDVLIAVADEGNSAIYFNRAWIELTGRPMADLIEFGWVDLIHPEDKEMLFNNYLIAFKERVPFTWEFRNLTKNNDYRWLLSKGLPRFRADGSFAGYISSCIDITEQKMDQQRKNDFIAMVSHELKTPLTTLNGYLQLLQQGWNVLDDKDILSFLGKSTYQTRKMNTLITGFLDVSRVDAGKILLKKDYFLIDELLKECISEVVSIQPLWSIIFVPCPPVSVYADRDKIGNAISNLIHNATKYGKPGGRIEVKCESKNDYIHISVSDEGIGISSEHLQKLFDRFYRVENGSNISGFGIGLYLSAEIIQRHDGKIWAESELGKGSTFHFTIPVLQGIG